MTTINNTSADAERILNIANWIDSQVNYQGGSPEEPPQPGTQFDYELAQAASELMQIARGLITPATTDVAADSIDTEEFQRLATQWASSAEISDPDWNPETTLHLWNKLVAHKDGPCEIVEVRRYKVPSKEADHGQG